MAKKYFEEKCFLCDYEREAIQEVFDDINSSCHQKFGLDYIHANSLYWTGERFVRFVMINGSAVVTERFHSTRLDSAFEDENKYKNSSILF